MNDQIQQEIQNAIDWYMRQGKRYYYRIYYKAAGQSPMLRAVMDETLTGNKEAIAEKLGQELAYIATRNEFPIYLRVGGSANDANPSEMVVFPNFQRGSSGFPVTTSRVNGIGEFAQAGIYGPEHIDLIKNNAKLEHEIELLKFKQEHSGNAFWVELANSEFGKNIISGVVGLVSAITKQNPASLAGFNDNALPNLQPPAQQNTMPQEISMETLYINYIDPLENNLQRIKPGMTVIDLLAKLVELSNAAASGDQIAKFKITTALNNL